MKTDMTIIAAAEKVKRDIEAAIEDIQRTEVYVENIMQNKDNLILALASGKETIYISTLIDPEKMAVIRETVFEEIESARNRKLKALENLIVPREMIKKAADEAVQEFMERSKGEQQEEEPNTEQQEKEPATEQQDTKEPAKEQQEPEIAPAQPEENGGIEEIRRMYLDEMLSVKEIALKVKLSEASVYNRIERYGIYAEWSAEKCEELAKKGKTVQQISKYFGMYKKECFARIQKEHVRIKDYKKNP